MGVDEQIATLKAEIDSHKSQGGSQENQRRRIVSDLEEKLQKSIARADMYEEKTVHTQKTLGALKAGMQSIFDKIGCKDMPGASGMEESDTNDSNMIEVLGLIEERTNQILSGSGEEGEEGGSGGVVLGLGPQTPAGAI